MSGSTIAAVATAPGRGGVAVIRISGPDAIPTAERLSGRVITTPGLFHARILAPTSGELLDDAVVLVFKAPSSYTGEDVVEIQCHGGSVVPGRILEACFAAGARAARCGEFTERAFLNGKLDLTAAEAVIDLVDAKTDRAAAEALRGVSGEKRTEFRALYEETLATSAELEHLLDVDESDVPVGFDARIRSRVDTVCSRISKSLEGARRGRILREGALVVLAGAPNAGKSSLLNAMLGEKRAIVSDVPGTTRDSIEEMLDLDGWPVRLVDTAGLRGTDDAIEEEGVRRARALISKADVVLALDCEIDGAIRIHAKSDLGPGEGLPVSSVTGAGLAELKSAIVARLNELGGRSEERGVAPSEREVAILMEARTLLAGFATNDLVLAANAVRAAADTLARLIGAVYSDDLLSSLFSRFCVGK